MPEYTPHQKKIIERYYDNRDAIMLQKLSELVTELYLAETDAKRERLWERAAAAMKHLKIKESIAGHILAKRKPEILASHVKDWLAQPPASSQEERRAEREQCFSIRAIAEPRRCERPRVDPGPPPAKLIPVELDPGKIEAMVSRAVRRFWATRAKQAEKQSAQGVRDQGARSAVTGGAQMDGFIEGLAGLIRDAGVNDASMFRNRALELPGYFRPTKKWDMLVVADGKLLAVVEAKSQVGPSFGNNFNNRVEEAIGSAVDLWTAYREGAFGESPRPWLGYVFLLEDCPASLAPVTAAEPHFEVFEEFHGASYAKRYEILCRKLVRERHYEATAYLMSERTAGLKGSFTEPAADLRFDRFARSLAAYAAAFASEPREN
jgi:hypothetical protein